MDFHTLKSQVLSNRNPYRTVGREQLEYIGGNFYKVDGIEMEVTPEVAADLDTFIGLSRKQAKTVETASGETGIRNFRNYLASANSISSPMRIAIVGDRNTRRITKAVPLKGELITAEAFFDFAEMFMDRNGYSPRSCMVAEDSGTEFSIILDSEHPEISAIMKDEEDFLTNSIYLKWNPGEIELGHYYERLICSNGQVERIHSSDAVINSLETEKVNKMLALPDSKIMSRGFLQFSNVALLAMNTRTSMQELKYVSTFLEKFGLDAHEVEKVAPYRKELQEYAVRGYDIDRNNAATTLASMTVWNLYNSVTAFASHYDMWSEDDCRRMAVYEAAVQFLYRDRDIKNYTDIFRLDVCVSQ